MLRKIKNKITNYKPLPEYSDDELNEFLENNSDTDASVLAYICSEILRRQSKKLKEKSRGE